MKPNILASAIIGLFPALKHGGKSLSYTKKGTGRVHNSIPKRKQK